MSNYGMKEVIYVATFNNMDDLLKAVKKKAEKASGNVPLTELFHERFMKSNTRFENIQEFFDAFPIKFQTQEEWNAIEDAVKDEFVESNTDFKTWAEMMKKAATEHIKSKMK